MEAVIFIGIQGAGKSTFFKQKFADTHVRINRDMLKTKHREKLLLAACLEGKQPFVIDKTNATREERAVYIEAAKTRGFRVVGYYFGSSFKEALARNNQREGKAIVPEKALLGFLGKLKKPSFAEGFDELFYVRINENSFFVVTECND
ncbi:MAG TPA: AAA family ATPase [Pyrinomonadaceae bacterium]|nr:AAA family ATPase [Pyrinomonadaceae bacterium]